jgi:hypothetical protein
MVGVPISENGDRLVSTLNRKLALNMIMVRRWWRSRSQFTEAAAPESKKQQSSRMAGKRRRHRVNRTSGSIKVEMEGVTVLIVRGADATTIAAVLHALKAGE